ncbi:helix-turn-helix domain-containing protein [Cellulosimicrobium composti]|uniref:helix-turn-helix domain-containing protein n=1 Tax=Cellulosimicrobium composti TaxID=2672572 RepID=UPI00289C6895|nr:helix-turn-helix domain-containing protein [Cellulosimicrobium composti]
MPRRKPDEHRGAAGPAVRSDHPRGPQEARLVAGGARAGAGLSRPTIARVESDNDVSTATIGKIARALGLTLELTERG